MATNSKVTGEKEGCEHRTTVALRRKKDTDLLDVMVAHVTRRELELTGKAPPAKSINVSLVVRAALDVFGRLPIEKRVAAIDAIRPSKASPKSRG